MKKRIPALLAAVLIVLASAATVFASGLEIVDVSPADGSKGYQPSNMAVKIRFSEDMMDEDAIAANAGKFQIEDAEGTEQPYDIVYNADKYPDELWLVLQGDLEADSEYTVTIDPGIVSSSGSTLSEGMTTTFFTRNTRTDGLISMGLMVVLMVVMFGTTARAARKQQEQEDPKAAERALEDSLNPYKIAKQKGISVEEAQALVVKEEEGEGRSGSHQARRDEGRAAQEDGRGTGVLRHGRKRAEEGAARRRHLSRQGTQVHQDSGRPHSQKRASAQRGEAQKGSGKVEEIRINNEFMKDDVYYEDDPVVIKYHSK